MNTKLQKQGNEQSILHFLSGGGEDVVECLRKKMIYYILHSEILSAQIVVYFLIMGL